MIVSFIISISKNPYDQLSPGVKNDWGNEPGLNYTVKACCMVNLFHEGGIKFNCASTDEKVAF